MEIKVNRLSEIRQTLKDRYCIVSLIEKLKSQSLRRMEYNSGHWRLGRASGRRDIKRLDEGAETQIRRIISGFI
jgi:hypothetical protein